MKNPHRASEGAKHSGAAVRDSIATLAPCPYAPECRRRWTHFTGTEFAECCHCYQLLSRTDMARILAGV